MRKGCWVPLGRKIFTECCDCGLQHEIDVRIKPKSKTPLQWRATPLRGKNRVKIA